MTTSPRRLVAALLAVLAVAGCSRAAPGPSAPGPAAAPTPSGPPESPLATDAPPAVPAGAADEPSWAPAPVDLDGLDAVASVDGERLLLHTASGDVDFLPGIDLGATIPGHAPGEVATRASDYRRWFPMKAGAEVLAEAVREVTPAPQPR